MPEPGESGQQWLGRVARAYREQLLVHPLAAIRAVVSPESRNRIAAP
ncbi:hypothetical protein [Amycolatopsis orientalis]|nr:hypothetical protein [Amycolatopsis orientalis]